MCIERLIFKQIAILLFADTVFEHVTFMCGVRQGGPLSGYLFAIACACLLAAASLLSGVLFTKGFCDNFQCLVTGIQPVRAVIRLIEEFEAASGAWQELAWLGLAWPG